MKLGTSTKELNGSINYSSHMCKAKQTSGAIQFKTDIIIKLNSLGTIKMYKDQLYANYST